MQNEEGAPVQAQALSHTAREAIASGRLPGRRPQGIWGGPGSGAGCALCERPVPPDAIGFEIEFAGADGDPEVHHLHLQCFAAWELVCRGDLQEESDDGTMRGRGRSSNGQGAR